jgi:2-methylcitrate dehydratase PrpD
MDDERRPGDPVPRVSRPAVRLVAGSPEELLGRLVADTPSSAIPAAARSAAALQVFDAVGVTLAAAAEPAGQAIGTVIGRLGGTAEARVIGTAIRTSSVQAAWANGALGHLLDFDDAGFSHPTVCIYPAALALAEAADLDGRTFLDALVLGYEVFERLAASGRADDPRLRRRGYHPTSIYGAVAAAAAAGRILGLDPDQLVIAFGLAASDASGLTQQFGTWGKGLNAGNAARSGVLAALLAQAGYWGDEQGLSGEHGLFSAIHGPGRYDFAGIAPELGTRWSIVDPGLTIKLYPACGSVRRAVDAVLALADEPGYDPLAVEHVTVDVHPQVFNQLQFRAPLDGFRGKFSLDYCVASAALDGRLDLDSFSDAQARRPELRAMIERVELREHPEWEIGRYREVPIEVRFRDGTVEERSVRHVRGTRRNPLSQADVVDKFVACAARLMPPDAAESAATAVLAIADAPSIRRIVDAVTGPLRPTIDA